MCVFCFYNELELFKFLTSDNFPTINQSERERERETNRDVYLNVDVMGSAIGFTIVTVLLSSWALTFAIGGKSLFGSIWDQLVMYNLADKWGLTGWD